jgi:exopolyphosphatase/guanosine-5'-triphosphate,3'-diphosphate pyrophosphatase
MDEPQRLAAIDAGSNGLKLATAYLREDGTLGGLRYSRRAVRLGTDAFRHGHFLGDTIVEAGKAFASFRKRLDDLGIERVRAVATAATRAASNRDELIRTVHDASGIRLELISPEQEAEFVLRSVGADTELVGRSALLVDMGGGTVEISALEDDRALACRALPLGPVRILEELHAAGLGETDADRIIEKSNGEVRTLIESAIGQTTPAVCLAVGGNVKRMGKLGRRLLGRSSKRLSREDLDTLTEQVQAVSLEERVGALGMRRDRADIIVIALMVMRWIVAESGVQRVVVSRGGLRMGVLLEMAEQLRREQAA